MGLIETLSKEYPVPYKRTRDMSESEYMKLVDRNTELLDENKTLKEEIERLNNIINELEKWLDEEYQYYDKYGSAPTGWAMGQINRTKDKLQELKGSDK